ncbi:MAG: hypothetical protein ACOC5T_05730 [Elusimicrobiota bacterium]
MNIERLLLISKNNFKKFKESQLHLFIRCRGFEPIGIMTKFFNKYDSSWGVMRQWVKGLTFDGDKFEEPIDRKNQRTGELENLVQFQNDFLIVTSRNSSNLDSEYDENNDNFQYFINPHTANKIKDDLDSVKEKNRVLMDLKKRLDDENRKKNRYMRESDAANSEANSLREKVSNLHEKLGIAQERAEYYKTQLKRHQIDEIEHESYLEERAKDAKDRGEMLGKDSADLVVAQASKQAEAKRKLDEIGAGSMTEYATKNDLKKQKEDIITAISNLKNLEKEKTPTSKEEKED